MFKVDNKDNRATPGVVLVSLLLTFDMFYTLFLLLFLNMRLPGGKSLKFVQSQQ